jgi:hypothetical protein
MIRVLLAVGAPLLAAVLLCAALVVPGFAQGGGGGCLSNRDLQAAISAGEIPPVAEVLESQGVNPDDVLSVKACDEGGEIVYVVGVLDEYGEAQTLVLRAGF